MVVSAPARVTPRLAPLQLHWHDSTTPGNPLRMLKIDPAEGEWQAVQGWGGYRGTPWRELERADLQTRPGFRGFVDTVRGASLRLPRTRDRVIMPPGRTPIEIPTGAFLYGRPVPHSAVSDSIAAGSTAWRVAHPEQDELAAQVLLAAQRAHQALGGLAPLDRRSIL